MRAVAGTAAGELRGGRLADTRRRASDDCNFSREFKIRNCVDVRVDDYVYAFYLVFLVC